MASPVTLMDSPATRDGLSSRFWEDLSELDAAAFTSPAIGAGVWCSRVRRAIQRLEGTLGLVARRHDWAFAQVREWRPDMADDTSRLECTHNDLIAGFADLRQQLDAYAKRLSHNRGRELTGHVEHLRSAAVAWTGSFQALMRSVDACWQEAFPARAQAAS